MAHHLRNIDLTLLKIGWPSAVSGIKNLPTFENTYKQLNNPRLEVELLNQDLDTLKIEYRLKTRDFNHPRRGQLIKELEQI